MSSETLINMTVTTENGTTEFSVDGLTNDAKQNLLTLLSHVVYTDQNGQQYLNDLQESLYNTTWLVTNTLSHCTSSNASTAVTRGAPYSATITAAVGYTLTGATVSVTMGGVNITSTAYSNGTISIAAVTGALVITVTAAQAAVSSIDATFTQGTTVVYTNDSLDSLKSMLVVTATMEDTSTVTVPSTDYTLSGTLAEGTSTITVTFAEKTDTFTVNCTVKGFLYHFEQSLSSAGTKDFGWSGTENYGTGHAGTGYSYWHKADNDNDYGTIKNTSLSSSQTPDLSGDFTISSWVKVDTSGYLAYVLASIKYNTTASSTTVTNALTSSSIKNLATGWTADVSAAESARYKGVRFQSISGVLVISLFAADGTNRARVSLTPPSGFDSSVWHHYALTRKDGTVRLFIDGALICNFTYSKAIYFNTQVTTAAAFKADESNPGDTVTMQTSAYVDDLFVADYCKWDAAFDASAITY